MFVTMSKDILARENRAIGNFTTRQVLFGGIGSALALFIGFKGAVGFGVQTRIYLSVLAAMPFFIWGFVKIYDEPMEKILPIIIRDNYLNPVKRLYKAENTCITEWKKEYSVAPAKEEKAKGKKKKKAKKVVDKNHPVTPSKDPALKAMK